MLDLITANLPREAVLRLMEAADAAFIGAKRIADDMVVCEEPERAYMIGHHRHWGLEQGFRNAAESCGLTTIAPHTVPRGGRYSLIHAGKLLLARAKITTLGASLRPSKYMRELALLNRFLEPYQWDLFLEELELPRDTVFGLLITCTPKQGHDESVPAFVGIGVPCSDLSGWHFRDSLENVFAAYHSSNVEEVPDRVVPRLKVRRDRKTDGDGS